MEVILALNTVTTNMNMNADLLHVFAYMTLPLMYHKWYTWT